MASNLNVAWVLPTTRASGGPLDVSEIAGVEISLSADGGANWAVYDTFPPDVLSTVIPELDFGNWGVRGIVRDTSGRDSAPVDSFLVIPDTTAPGALLSLTLSL